MESTTQYLDGATITINYPVATVYIYAGGLYQQFGNTSLDYEFHVNASSPVSIDGFRNSSIFYLTVRRNTELRVSYFNTWIDRFDFTNNPRINHYSDIEVVTTTNTVFINKIVSRSTTSSMITLPRNQTIYLAKMEPTYQELTNYNFIINEEISIHEKKPPLSKAMTAVVIICCTVAFMAGYYTYNNRVALYKKLKTLIEYEDLLLYQIQENVGEEDEVDIPVLTDDRIDKKVMKYLKKAAKVAETHKHADGNVVAVFADRNGEIVDVVKNQQAFVSYQMTKMGRNTINMQRGEEQVNEVKKLVDEANTRQQEEFLQVGSMKGRGGRKNRAAMKMFNTAPTDLSTVAPGVQEGVLQDIEEDGEEEEAQAPEDTSPQITRARGHAMVKLNQVSPAEAATTSPTATNKKGAFTSFDSTGSGKNNTSTNNGTYKGSFGGGKSSKVSPNSVTSVKEVKPSEMKAGRSSSSASSAPSAVVSSSLAASAAAAAAPLTSGLYYYPPTSTFAAASASSEISTVGNTAPVSLAASTAPAVTTAAPAVVAPTYEAPVTTTVPTTDFTASLYGAAPITSSSSYVPNAISNVSIPQNSTTFDLNAGVSSNMPFTAPFSISNFDMSGINTSDFSTYAAGGFDASAMGSSYVPLSMDYNSSYLSSTADSNNPYVGAAPSTNFSSLHNSSFALDPNSLNATSNYFNQYGNTSNAMGSFDAGHVDPNAYGQFDPNAFQSNGNYSNAGTSGGGHYDYSTYNSNQYTTDAGGGGGGYQQYGSYNATTGY